MSDLPPPPPPGSASAAMPAQAPPASRPLAKRRSPGLVMTAHGQTIDLGL